MHALRFTPEAAEQLEALEIYIARAASARRAEHFVDAILHYCERLRVFPQRGAKRDDLRKGLRTIGFRRRVTILFEVTQDTVTIVGIYYGGQDFVADYADDEA